MQRDIIQDLIAWKDSPHRKPLLLKGARQTGKTYTLRDLFGQQYFRHVAYFNLQNPDPWFLELFNEGSIEPRRILQQLELRLGADIIPGETLIIFDEIQEVPRVLTSLKYFAEETPEYHIAAAGSPLGVFLHQNTSYPVGKVQTLQLEPLNFREFLLASGQERLVKQITDHPKEVFSNGTLLDAFREYQFTGGMPEVVQDWLNQHSIEHVNHLQHQILDAYRSDFSKYSDNSLAVKIRQVFECLPSQFAKNNEKFLYSVIKNGARAREYELAIEWLVDAGIVRRVFRVQRGDQLPLKAYLDRSAFKLYFLDLGLFRALAEIPIEAISEKNSIFDAYNGLIAEQYVLQELSSFHHSLTYWNSNSDAEVDFVGQFGADIIPIEVKSGENAYAKSLKVYRERYKPRFAIRFSLKEIELNNGLLNIPLYKSFTFPSLQPSLS